MVEFVLRPHSVYLLHELAQMTTEQQQAQVVCKGRDVHYEELVGAGLLAKTPCQDDGLFAYTVTTQGMQFNQTIVEDATECTYF